VKFYHSWPKNDDEKWSRKNTLEILPCALRNLKNIFYFIEMRIFAKFTNSVTKMTFSHEGISKKFFVVYVLMVNETLSQKFHPCSIFTK
jgi:hypothetical protein